MKNLLLGLSLLTLALPVSAQESTAPKWAHLVPEGAVAVVMIPSYSQVASTASEIGKLFNVEEKLMEGLAMARMQLGPAGGDNLDESRAIVIAVEMPAGGGTEVPEPVIILPIKDAAPFAEMGLTTHGGWVAMTQSPITVSETCAPITNNFSTQGVAKVRVDLGTIFETYGKLILSSMEMGLSMVPVDEIPVDIDSILDTLLDATEEFMDSAQTMEMELSYGGGHANFQTSIAFAKDTPLAKAFSGAPTGIRQLIGSLGGEHPIMLASTMDLTDFLTGYMKLMKGMMSEVPGIPEEMTQLFGEVEGMMGEYTGRMAAGYSLTASGMHAVQVMEAKNPQNVVDFMHKLLGLPLYKEMGIEMVTGEKRKVGEMSVTPMTMQFGETMREQLAAEIGDEGMGVMDRLLGKDGMKMDVGTIGSYLVQTLNGTDADLTKAAAGLAGQGKAPASMNNLLALGGSAPSFVFFVDAGAVVGLAAGVAREMGEDEAPDPASVPSAKVGMVMGSDQGKVNMGLSADLSALAGLVKVLDK